MSKSERRGFLKKALATLAAIPIVGCRKEREIPGAMCYVVMLSPNEESGEQPDHQDDKPNEEPSEENQPENNP